MTAPRLVHGLDIAITTKLMPIDGYEQLLSWHCGVGTELLSAHNVPTTLRSRGWSMPTTTRDSELVG